VFDRFSLNLGVFVPLAERDTAVFRSEQTQGELGNNLTLRASLTYHPYGAWFATVTGHAYLRPLQQAPWDPDFTYVFGYDDWRPHTFSLTYANYGGNRFVPDRAAGERFTRFLQGTVALGYKFPAPSWLAGLTLVHPSGSQNHRLSYEVTPEYFDLASLSLRNWKHRVGLYTRYVAFGNWYLDLNLFAYPAPDRQQPWDPDFTYGFGYFDWRSGTFSVQYNNYSGNRFPWRNRAPGTGRFLDGALSIVWTYAF
jgi:hypothetical protein